MVRRLTALLAIFVLLIILLALVWTVHLHRRETLQPHHAPELAAIASNELSMGRFTQGGTTR